MGRISMVSPLFTLTTAGSNGGMRIGGGESSGSSSLTLTCLSQLTSVFRHFRPLFSRNSLRCNDGVSPPCVGQTYPLFNGRKLCHSAHSDASENAPAKQRRQGASLFQRGREPAPAHREDRSAPRALPGRDQ